MSVPTPGPSGTSTVDAAPKASANRWLVLAVVALAQLTVVLDGTIVNIALPQAQAELGMSDGDRSWVVTLYALTFGALLLLGGRIADFWGRKRSFLIGMGGFALASALGGIATTGGMLLVARGFQGAFAALLAPAALAILSVTFPGGRDRVRAFAVYGTIAGGGAAVGLLLGGVLTEYFSWHWCLLVNVPIAVVAIAVGIPLLRESRADGSTRYDVPGAVLVSLGLASVVYGFSRAEAGWIRADTLGFLALGVVLLGLFVLVESRSAHPLLPLRIITHRARAGAYLSSVAVGAALLGALLYLTLHFQIVLGMSPLMSGLASLPMTAAIIVSAGIVSRLLPTVGPRILMTAGPLIAAAGLLVLSRITVGGSYALEVLPAQILLGIGLALVFVPLQNVALLGIAPRDAGVASAAVTATQQIGGSIGTAVFTALYTVGAGSMAGAAGGLQPLVDGYSVVFLAAAIALALASPISWVLINVPRDEFTTSDEAVHLG
ncbi:MFS transporter [Arthrobacter agilis]|jgi:EmrB/QacA subfamily drug resistance transporter|uniref:MFS transporter n=1 Tax=Arthrobacter agilis TaxID=37921 RepID=UPI00277EB877|nr:MFS transporter [Arthrobacter agilis]MDQ0736633.1 EmrB/QacA subfamily drug resistance transporter [Arthrobacter agilis]